MERRLIWDDQTRGVRPGPDQTLKATALLYLAEALEQEQFEEAAEIIRNAKRFGAQQAEIDAVITEYLFGGGGDQEEEGGNQFQGRKRF